MRIVHVSDCYLPRTGGIETQVRSLAQAQRAMGHEVRIITATPGHDGVRSGLDVVDGIEVHRVAANLPGEIPVHPRTAMHVGRILCQERTDVVHVHAGVISPFAWGAVRAAHAAALPTAVTVHSVWGPLARPAFRISDALVRWSSWGVAMSAVSDVAAERIRAALGSAVPVTVLPNGIDVQLWAPPSTPKPSDASHLRVVSVLRLAPRKRVGALLRATALAAQWLLPDVLLSLDVIGDGPERARAERLARRLGVATTFHGRLDRDRMKEVFARSDVFCQASVRESFGIAALEARTFGLPVVARSQTGTGEFVRHGVNGLLAPDDRALARSLVLLGRNRDLLERMAMTNRDQPPEQTWPHVVARSLDLYRLAGAQAP